MIVTLVPNHLAQQQIQLADRQGDDPDINQPDSPSNSCSESIADRARWFHHCGDRAGNRRLPVHWETK